MALVVRSWPEPGRRAAGAIGQLRPAGHRVRILFLDAPTDVLVRRYSSSRRRHPLADEAGAMPDAIEHERLALRAGEGRGRPGRRHQRPQRPPAARPLDRAVRCRGAGARHADERSRRSATSTASRSTSTSCSTAASCPNPYWVEDLRHPFGPRRRGARVRLRQHVTADFLARLDALLDLLLPAYVARARATSRSPSAAPAASTARSSSPRRSPAGSASTATSRWSFTATSTSNVATGDERPGGPLPTGRTSST